MRQIVEKLKSLGRLFASARCLQTTGVLVLLVNPVQAATYYFHNDHLGTPQVVTDMNQEVVWKGEYDPFGKVTETVALVEQNLRFPGQYFDVETGLHYNYFRTYDPTTGRYVESDLIGLGGGLSTYGYVHQSPQNGMDPSGLYCLAIGVRVTCHVPGGGPMVQFPRPDGWPVAINGNEWNYHFYDLPAQIGQVSHDCVMAGIVGSPTPGNPMPATPEGTLNNATPNVVQNLFNVVDYVSSFGNDRGGYNNSPVNSYKLNSGSVVVNVTQLGHPLHPGYVARTVENGVVRNRGEGLGFLQSKFNPAASSINEVWIGQSHGIVDACSCRG